MMKSQSSIQSLREEVKMAKEEKEISQKTRQVLQKKNKELRAKNLALGTAVEEAQRTAQQAVKQQSLMRAEHQAQLQSLLQTEQSKQSMLEAQLKRQQAEARRLALEKQNIIQETEQLKKKFQQERLELEERLAKEQGDRSKEVQSLRSRYERRKREHEQTVRELEQALEQSMNQLDRANKFVEDSQSRQDVDSGRLKSTLAQIEEELARTRQVLSARERELNQGKAEWGRTVAQLHGREQELAAKAEELRSAEGKVRALQSSVEQLQAEQLRQMEYLSKTQCQFERVIGAEVAGLTRKHKKELELLNVQLLRASQQNYSLKVLLKQEQLHLRQAVEAAEAASQELQGLRQSALQSVRGLDQAQKKGSASVRERDEQIIRLRESCKSLSLEVLSLRKQLGQLAESGSQTIQSLSLELKSKSSSASRELGEVRLSEAGLAKQVKAGEEQIKSLSASLIRKTQESQAIGKRLAGAEQMCRQLQTKTKQLEAQIEGERLMRRNYEEEKSRLESELAERETRLLKLKEDINRKNDVQKQLSQKSRTLERQLQTEVGKGEQFARQLQRSRLRAARQEQQLEGLSTALAEKESQLSGLAQQLSICRKQKAECEQTVHRLTLQGDQLLERQQILQRQVKSLTAEAAGWKDKAEAAQFSASRLRSQVAALQQQQRSSQDYVKRLQSELSLSKMSWGDSHSVLKQENQKIRNRLEQAQASLAAKQVEIQQLSKGLAQSQAQRATQAKEIRRLEDQATLLQEETENLSNLLLQRSKELKELQLERETALQKQARLGEQAEELRAAAARETLVRRRLTDGMNSKDIVINSLQARLSSLSAELEQSTAMLKQRLLAESKEREELAGKYQALLLQLQQSKTVELDTKAENQAMKVRRLQLQLECAQLKIRQEESAQGLRAKTGQTQKLQQQAQAYSRRLLQLQSELSRTSAARERAEKTISKVSADLRAKQQQLAQLESELDHRRQESGRVQLKLVTVQQSYSFQILKLKEEYSSDKCALNSKLKENQGALAKMLAQAQSLEKQLELAKRQKEEQARLCRSKVSQVCALQQQIDTLKGQSVWLKEKLREEESAHRECRRLVDEYSQKLASCEENSKLELSKLAYEKSALRAALEEAVRVGDCSRREWEAEVGRARERVKLGEDRLKEQLAQLRDELTRKEESLFQCRTTLGQQQAKCREKLRNAAQEVVKVTRQRQSAHLQLQELARQKDKNEKALRLRVETLAVQLEEKQAFIDQTQKLQLKLKQAQEETQAVKTMQVELEEQLERERRLVTQQQSKLQRLTEQWQKEKLQLELALLHARNSGRAAAEQLRRVRDSVSNKDYSAQTKIDQLTSENKKLGRLVEALREELAYVQKELREARESLQTVRGEQGLLLIERTELATLLNQELPAAFNLQDKCQLARQVGLLKRALSQREQSLRQAQNSMAKLQQKERQAASERERLQLEIKGLAFKVNQLQQNGDAYASDLLHLEREVEQLEQCNDQLRTQSARLRTELRKAREECQSQKSQLESQGAKLVEYIRQVEEGRRDERVSRRQYDCSNDSSIKTEALQASELKRTVDQLRQQIWEKDLLIAMLKRNTLQTQQQFYDKLQKLAREQQGCNQKAKAEIHSLQQQVGQLQQDNQWLRELLEEQDLEADLPGAHRQSATLKAKQFEEAHRLLREKQAEVDRLRRAKLGQSSRGKARKKQALERQWSHGLFKIG